jgi:2'-5' RNA ligase
VRAFAAIELDSVVRDALAGAARTLHAAKPPLKLKWVSPDHQHVTLHFFGDIDANRVDEITQALRRAAGRVAPFEITLADLGCFPNIYKPNVLWAGMREPDSALKRLHTEVSAELALIGFASDSRAFTPHLTLARVPREADIRQKKALGEWFVRQAVEPAAAGLRVTQVCLMRSELLRGGPHYTTLSVAPLAGAERPPE